MTEGMRRLPKVIFSCLRSFIEGELKEGVDISAMNIPEEADYGDECNY